MTPTEAINVINSNWPEGRIMLEEALMLAKTALVQLEKSGNITGTEMFKNIGYKPYNVPESLGILDYCSNEKFKAFITPNPTTEIIVVYKNKIEKFQLQVEVCMRGKCIKVIPTNEEIKCSLKIIDEMINAENETKKVNISVYTAYSDDLIKALNEHDRDKIIDILKKSSF